MRDSIKVVACDQKGRLKGIRNTDPTKISANSQLIENANNALNDAERNFSNSLFPQTIRDCQVCVEQSIKALSETLKIPFKTSGGSAHNPSENLQMILEVLELKLEQGMFASVRNRLSRAGFLSQVLYASRKFAIYGDEKFNVPADVIFSGNFGHTFASNMVEETDVIYRAISETIAKLLE